MKRILALGIILFSAAAVSIASLFLFSASLEASSERQEVKLKLIVIAEKAPVYFDPDTSSPIIGNYIKGIRLTSAGIDKGMYRVMVRLESEDRSTIGYIAAKDVKVLDDKADAGTSDLSGFEEKKFSYIGLDIYAGAGPAWFDGGDITNGVRGLSEEMAATLAGLGYAIADRNVGNFRSGLSVYPDLVFHLSPKLSVGIGGEYSYARNLDTLGYAEGGALRNADATATLKAFVVRPGIHLTLPLSPSLEVRLTGGPVFIVMNFRYERNYLTSLITESLRLSAKDWAVGAQAGVAFEFRLNERLGFFLGVRGQVARAGSLEGDEHRLILDRNGIDVSEPAKTGTLGFTRRSGFPVLTVPGEDGASDLKNAVFDFTGIGLSAGLRIRF